MAYALGDVVDVFSLPQAGGEPYTVDFTAAATVVVWTCNHCPYALAWHDRLQDVARDYGDRGAAFVQINANNSAKYPLDSFDRMVERVAAGELASPYLRDEEQTLSKVWGARVTPDVFVVDGDRRVVYRGAPDEDHEDPLRRARWLRDSLDAVLSGRTVARPVTKPMGCAVKWIVNDQPDPYAD
jgi:hypothetical protein